MISESQQEQASLYALGLLDADEAAAFEQQMEADATLTGFVRELRETVALLALTGDGEIMAAPPALRERVLASVAVDRPSSRPDGTERPLRRRDPWLPWAIAALFSGFAGAFFWLYLQQLGEIHGLRGDVKSYKRILAEAKPADAPDALAEVSFCALEPTPEFATAQPRAAVLWDAAHRRGKLRVNQLAPPTKGKDYQLWTVEKDRKDPVNAGVVHVDAEGKADLPFRPADRDVNPVVAVAISLEQAGGSPTNQGPILLLGKF